MSHHNRRRASPYVSEHPQVLSQLGPHRVPLGDVISDIPERSIAVDAVRSRRHDVPSAYAVVDTAGYAVIGAFTAARVNPPAATLVGLHNALNELAGDLPDVIMTRDIRLLRVINAWRGRRREEIPPRELDPLLYRELAYDVLWLLRHPGVAITDVPAGDHVRGDPPTHSLFGPAWPLTWYMRRLAVDGITVDDTVKTGFAWPPSATTTATRDRTATRSFASSSTIPAAVAPRGNQLPARPDAARASGESVPS